MFQESAVAVVVFGGDDNQSVSAAHLRGKSCIFDGFAGVIGRQWQAADVDEVGLNAGPLCYFGGEQASDMCAQASFARCAENYRNIKRTRIHQIFLARGPVTLGFSW